MSIKSFLFVIAVVCVVALFTEPPACAKRLAAQGISGICIGK